MKQIGITLLLLSVAIASWANVTIRGHVRSSQSREALPDAEVRVDGQTTGVITNEDGYFALKLEAMPPVLTVSALGYKTTRVNTRTMGQTAAVTIWLDPDLRILSAVTIYSAEDIVRKALEKVPHNYTLASERLSCFYRETIRKQSHYVSINEAVTHLYKTGYDYGIERDKVQIVKARSLMSQKSRDTLSVKVMGGPQEAVLIDLVKNREILFSQDDLPAYRFEMEPGTSIDDRPQYVIRFTPVEVRDYPLFTGTIYVDAERLSFTRIESWLDVSDAAKATRFMLVRKPRGLRFKPRALHTTVSYHTTGSCSRISYMRNVYHFNCDWKRRLFATSYRAVSEMVVTDHEPSEVPRSRKHTFSHFDLLDSGVADFGDPDFWQEYNILEPSESLEHAVERLKRRAR